MAGRELSWIFLLPINCRCGQETEYAAAVVIEHDTLRCKNCGQNIDLTSQEWSVFRQGWEKHWRESSHSTRTFPIDRSQDRGDSFLIWRRPPLGISFATSRTRVELIMRRMALVLTFVVGLTAPTFAQKAEIEAVNSKWIEFFNKGDFTGIASLYTDDATAFPPGSAMVKGRAAIGAMWKSMAEQVSDPKLITLDVKPLGPSAAREIGTFTLKTKGPTPQEVTGKYVVVWEKIGNEWKLESDIWNDGK
jgi:uncharacterized protein (TIGR02246 family)